VIKDSDTFEKYIIATCAQMLTEGEFYEKWLHAAVL